nr:ABC transporter permease [Acidobacteriota bacterium]
IAGFHPVADTGATTSLTVEGVGRFLNGGDFPTPGRKMMCSGAMGLLGATMLHGRDFEGQDRLRTQRIAIVNEAAAQAYWGRSDVVGRRLRFRRLNESEQWATIVGVVSNMRHEGLRGPMKPEIYLPLGNEAFSIGSTYVIFRTASADARAIETAVRRPLGFLPLRNFQLKEEIRKPFAHIIETTRNLVAFAAAGLAVYLACLLALTRFLLVSSRRAIGVRLALGSTAGGVKRFWLRRQLLWDLPVALFGVGVSIAAMRLLQSSLVDIAPPSLSTLLIPAGAYVAIVGIAVYFEVARATADSPARLLKG